MKVTTGEFKHRVLNPDKNIKTLLVVLARSCSRGRGSATLRVGNGFLVALRPPAAFIIIADYSKMMNLYAMSLERNLTTT